MQTLPDPTTTTTKRRRSAKARRDPGAPLRVAIVTRLSKPKKLPKGTAPASEAVPRKTDEVSHETQEAGCRRKVEAMGGVVVAVFRDTVSGDRLDRDGLWAGVDLVRAGKADALMTYAVDRLGRDQVQQAVIVYEVRRAGGEYLSATEDLAEGPLGDFMRSTYAFAAEIELAKTRERTGRALDAKFAAARRYKPARRPPYGYLRVGEGVAARYAPHPEEAEVVRRVFREAAAGVSRRKIAEGLDRDGVPTWSGRGKWGITTVVTILGRAAYWTGEHECWRTRTARDAEGVPYREARPAEDRYAVPFPPLVDPELARLAHAAAARNVWRARRDDRPAEVGIGRYGFFRCGGCGRALAAIAPKRGNPRYACTHQVHGRPCPAPASISLPDVDRRVWEWLWSVLEDPAGGERWRYVPAAAGPDPAALEALAGAEARVAELAGKAAALAENLTLVTGAAAGLLAAKLDAIAAELAAAEAERDRLAAAAAPAPAPRMGLALGDALARAVLRAVAAMRAADPAPAQTRLLTLRGRLDAELATEGVRARAAAAGEPGRAGEATAYLLVPDTWAARRAAMAALDLAVTVNQQGAGAPRWVAEMRPGGGVAVRGEGRAGGSYLNRTRRCSG